VGIACTLGDGTEGMKDGAAAVHGYDDPGPHGCCAIATDANSISSQKIEKTLTETIFLDRGKSFLSLFSSFSPLTSF